MGTEGGLRQRVFEGTLDLKDWRAVLFLVYVILKVVNIRGVFVWLIDHRLLWLIDHRLLWLRDYSLLWLRDHRLLWLIDHRLLWLIDHILLWLIDHSLLWLRDHLLLFRLAARIVLGIARLESIVRDGLRGKARGEVVFALLLDVVLLPHHFEEFLLVTEVEPHGLHKEGVTPRRLLIVSSSMRFLVYWAL